MKNIVTIFISHNKITKGYLDSSNVSNEIEFRFFIDISLTQLLSRFNRFQTKLSTHLSSYLNSDKSLEKSPFKKFECFILQTNQDQIIKTINWYHLDENSKISIKIFPYYTGFTPKSWIKFFT